MKPHKNIYARYVLLEITMTKFICLYDCRGRFYAIFFWYYYANLTSASITWNFIKFYTQYICIKMWPWYNLCRYCWLKGAVIVFFPKILKVVVSRLLLNKIAQKFTSKYILLETTKMHLRICFSIEVTAIFFF